MRRPIPLLIGLSLALTACAGSAGTADNTTAGNASTTIGVAPVPEQTTSTEGPSSTVQSTDPTTAGRPVAPDFTLELGDGGEYILSEGAMPVYLVFWAEW